MLNQKFMLLAIKEAKRGVEKKHGGPFGAVIVKDEKIIAKAHNHVFVKNDPTAHAEIEAIRKASKKLKNYDMSGCEIYSTTEPCPMCYTALHWAKIGTIYFGTKTADTAKLGFHELNISDQTLKELGHDKEKLISGFMQKECYELLEWWKNKHVAVY